MNVRIVANVFGMFLTSYLVVGCKTAHSSAAVRQNLHEITSPVLPGSISPRVTSVRDGSVLLSWLEPENDKTAALRYSFWQHNAWSATATVAVARPFSRHPSESPAIVALSEKNLIAYWSQKPQNAEDSDKEVDVYFSVSTDRGAHWTSPALANRAGTGEESSYPSAAALDASHAALIWLDGSFWKQERRVTLMSRTVQSDGSATEATILDRDTCTCCPTSLARTNAGLLAAYRGHTPQNIRDISLLQNVQGSWSQPRTAHADNWRFQGCPVNGPHLDADGATVVLIWFSAPQDQPEVKVAFSNDGGSHFDPPVRIDTGNAIGRAQIMLLPGHSALALWLEHQVDATRLLARRVLQNRTVEPPLEVARGAGLGYPHAAHAGKDVFVTWAEEKAVPQIHFAILETESN